MASSENVSTKGMVLIPGGTFTMGVPANEINTQDNEMPKRSVTVESFYMDIYLVTQSEFEKVMGFNPSHFWGSPNCAVDSVTKTQAEEYCKRVGKRLPTEAEWEYAARAGTTGPVYWGNDEEWRDYAYFMLNSGFRTTGVGMKKPNAFGLYDMLGNVWEWCADVIKGSEKDGVLRGNSWYDTADYVRVTNRRFAKADNPADPVVIGFRCAL